MLWSSLGFTGLPGKQKFIVMTICEINVKTEMIILEGFY